MLRKPIDHSTSAELVEHLDELRYRLLVCIGSLLAIGAVCFWQNGFLLKLANGPLDGRHPITLSPGEPFMITLKVSLYAALIIALPIIVYQISAYLMPVLHPRTQRNIRPLLITAPLLFVLGVAFSYEFIFPSALHFLLGFNNKHFKVEVRASDYYSFFFMLNAAVGLIFQIPSVFWILGKLELITSDKMKAKRKYAIMISAAVAAALPGADPASTLLEMIPMIALYQLSIWIVRLVERRRTIFNLKESTRLSEETLLA
jgi:sec-independent protein translocase protein TatC